MFGVFLDDRQNARGDDAMRLAEIAVNLLQCQCDLLLQSLELFGERQRPLRHVGLKRGGCLIFVVVPVVMLIK
jgi:hypothetical protein